MTVYTNSVGAKQPGVQTVQTDGTFTGSVLTQHDVLVGGANSAVTSVSPSTAGLVLTSNGISVDPSFQSVSASGAITSITGNSGGAEVPLSGNFNILGSGSISVDGTANTETVSLTGLTSHSVLVGAGTSTITKVAPSATSGIPLVSNGALADPSFTTALVPGGGTGIVTATAYAPICGGTTATGNFQSADTGLATSGFILTSNGSGSLPTWQANSGGGAVLTVNGDTGSISGNTVTVFANNATNNCGSTVKFVNSGTISTLNVTDASNNTTIGNLCGNTSGYVSSTGVGAGVLLHATIAANNCTGVGTTALGQVTSGQGNTGFGSSSLGAVTDGELNTAIGMLSLGNSVHGSFNIAMGYNAGTAYTGTESSNICIQNIGVLGESNVIRIGTQGSSANQQNLCYIAGITGATPTSANTPQVVLCDNTGNLAPISSSTSGFVLTSNGSATPSFQSPAFTQMPYSDKATSFSAAVGNGYFVTGAATATLPASPTDGNVISFIVDTASTLTVTANTGQKIRLGASISASAGTAASNSIGDSLTLVYRSSDAVWFARESIGTWSIT